MSAWLRGAAFVALVGAAGGCATRGDLLQQDRTYRKQLTDQRRQIESVQRELERLRADVDAAGVPRGGGVAGDERIGALERRVEQLEMNLPGGLGTSTEPPGAFPPEEPAVAAPPPAAPPPVPPVARPTEADGWRQDVAREQAAAGTTNVAERAEYLKILDVVASGDCPRAVPQLNGFASTYKDSPLADNAVYWAARCYARRGDHNQAISKFYDVVTRYPKGDKAAAALWAQGNVFVGIGDSPDARLAFAKLIRDYPQSEEAAQARQKLGELED